MKRYIKQIAALAMLVAFASCSSDDDVAMADNVGGSVAPQTASISRLDNNYNLPSKIYTKEGVTATKVEIYKNTAAASEVFVRGAKVSDATIADGVASFNTSTLGSFDVFPNTATPPQNIATTGTFSLLIVSTYSDGSTTTMPFTLTVGKGIVWKVYNDDGDLVTNATSGVTSFKIDDPTPVEIHYATVKKATTTIQSVVGEWRKNSDVTYSPLPDTYATTAGTIDIANIPYSTYGGLVAGDKITYRFKVTAGTQTDVISTTVTIADQTFGSSLDGSIANSASASKFSFLTGLSYDATNTANAEIEFADAFGIAKSGTTPIDFVKDNTLNYATTNLFKAEAAYNSVSKVTSLNNLNVGDVVVYKITRKVNFGTAAEPDIQPVLYTGILKVTDRVQGATSQELKFSFKEGVLSVAEED
ncbi:hypothetical protein [Flavobacterium johnsoniae]|uniref:Uncharacterized protein n=1 Tax=Flavobacterium johnsoniae TaxID=986 RepID=A0A1M5LA27_FLAJO|nr:hypothetical protein [Flavobacterium johnsoniae]SHG61952.1 hypothetical protein SAMN05444388_103395 [Flavobacterium johnsoniae]